MKSRRGFNPSLRLPVIDLIVAAVLIVVAGYFWLRTEGDAQLALAAEEYRQGQSANEAEAAAVRSSLEDVHRELDETERLRSLRAQHLEHLAARIVEEEERVAAAQDRDVPMVNKIQNLDLEIRGLRNQRMAFKNDLRQADDRLADQQSERTRLETMAHDRRQQIVEARTRLAAPPPSRFPQHIGVDLLFEGRAKQDAALITLSRVFQQIGPLDAGILGSIGMTTDGEDTILEAGLFFNLPLSPRRLSLDLEGGFSRFEPRGSRGSALSEGYVGARLRFAPMRHERLYLIAGTRHGLESEETSLRLGLALGRQ